MRDNLEDAVVEDRVAVLEENADDAGQVVSTSGTWTQYLDHTSIHKRMMQKYRQAELAQSA